MAGNSVTELLKGYGNAIEQPPVIRGYISTNRPAPTAFPIKGSVANLLYVIAPGYSTERPLGPCQWPAIHGSALPTQGAACDVVIDSTGIPTVVWWEGSFTSVARGTSLPASPYDGQEYDYVADATNGVIWRFRYRAASASTHKWEFIGGSELLSTENAHEPSGPQAPPAAFGTLVIEFTPGITLPLAGDYDILTQATALATNANNTDIRVFPVSYPSATILTSNTLFGFAVSAQSLPVYAPVSGWHRCAAIAAGTLAVLGFQGSNSTAAIQWYGKQMRARPVRVG